MSPNDEEVDLESDEDVDEVLDEEARDFLEITNLHDTPSARKSYRIGCVFCQSKVSKRGQQWNVFRLIIVFFL